MILFIILIIIQIKNKFPSQPNVALQEQLGAKIFFDTNLSEPIGMSCATCHESAQHFAGNNKGTFGVAIGSRPEITGMRNTPSIKYASFTPPFHFEEDEGELVPVGGMFWDGRVDTLAAQAKGPLFNPREMNNTNAASLTQKIAQSNYAELFRQVGGKDIFDDPERAANVAYNALQVFQGTEMFHPFSSKYDAYIQGRGTLTAEEKEVWIYLKIQTKVIVLPVIL